MRVPFIKILIPYILLIITIENKIFTPDIIIKIFLALFICITYIYSQFEKTRLFLLIYIFSLINLYLQYDLRHVNCNKILPEREVIAELIFDKKKVISGEIYYSGIIKNININNKYLNNLKIYSKIINFEDKVLLNKNLQIKGLLSYLNQNGYQEIIINRCKILNIEEQKSIINDIIIFYKKYIINVINKSSKVCPELDGFQKGVFLGKTESISNRVYNIFKFSGTLHLFAVSGLHIGFIYMIFKKLFSFIFLKRFITEFLVTIVLLLYLHIVDHPPSAVRALIMIISWQVSHIIYKKQNSLSSLVLSCFFVLFLYPGTIMDIGFQLSYTVVLSILVIRLNLREKMNLNKFRIKNSLTISFAAFCGSLLLIFDYFHIIVPGSILINLFLVPFVFITIICIFLNLTLNFDVFNYIIYFNYNSIIFITNNLSYEGITYFRFENYNSLNNICHLLYPFSLFIFFSRFNNFLPRYLSYILIPMIILFLFALISF